MGDRVTVEMSPYDLTKGTHHLPPSGATLHPLSQRAPDCKPKVPLKVMNWIPGDQVNDHRNGQVSGSKSSRRARRAHDHQITFQSSLGSASAWQRLLSGVAQPYNACAPPYRRP